MDVLDRLNKEKTQEQKKHPHIENKAPFTELAVIKSSRKEKNAPAHAVPAELAFNKRGPKGLSFFSCHRRNDKKTDEHQTENNRDHPKVDATKRLVFPHKR
jgi:hypothetical protein